MDGLGFAVLLLLGALFFGLALAGGPESTEDVEEARDG